MKWQRNSRCYLSDIRLQETTTAVLQSHQVVDDIGERPDKWHAEAGDAQQDDVQRDRQQQVGEPDPTAVHHPGVWVDLAVSHAHVHPGVEGQRLSVTAERCFYRI